ncbi:phage baseplate protein [Serratia marcescens]|uniref:phage baseplate protein n=1 Tax=Serratia marcescens TaxID=615 RepID=UPI003F7E51D6
MAKNEFKPFAIGEYANVLSQDEYEALPAVGAGFTAGVAKSEELNKVWRQSSVMSSVLGDFIAINSGDDVLDDGDTNRILQSLIKALSKPIIDVSHPVGTVALLAQNRNPNELFPGTTWIYLGENKTIRIGKSDGSDVGTTGGSDTINITRANLPQSVLNVSGSTSEQPAQTLKAKMAGRHTHQGGMRGPGPQYSSTISGTDNDGEHTLNWTSENGDHEHDVDMPAHAHTVWGQTEALGQGQEISIVESHIKLMGWYRIA